MFVGTPYEKTSLAGDAKEREARYKRIFKSSDYSFEGKTVLDLGCFDGRWSYAAHKLGASKVIGVDARELNILVAIKHIVEAAPISNVAFFHSDCNSYLKLLRENRSKFDVVLCLGLLYHVKDIIELCELIVKTMKEFALIETLVNSHEDISSFLFRKESCRNLDGAFVGNGISFIPSRQAIIDIFKMLKVNIEVINEDSKNRPVFLVTP